MMMSVLRFSLNIFNKLTENFPPVSSAEGDEQRRCRQDVPGVGETEIPGAAGQVQTPTETEAHSVLQEDSL